MQGDLESASGWADTFNDLPPDRSLMWLEEPQVTRARILLTRETGTGPYLAMQILDVLDEIVDRTHNTRYKIEILALRAVALEARGKSSQADLELKQAVALARPGGFARIFVDLGKPMQEMLQRLAEGGHLVESISRILAEFPGHDFNLADSISPEKPGRQRTNANLTLAEPLTPRELEVLDLLRGPSSVKEIAGKLHISYATAKRHTINIYAKLGVNQRWDAVARAEELNLLPSR